MLRPGCSVLRLRCSTITNEQTTQLAKRPICPSSPERLGAFLSCFLSAARPLTGSNIHSLDLCPAVSCIEGFCNASEARCLTSTMLMASQKPHRSANTDVRSTSAFGQTGHWSRHGPTAGFDPQETCAAQDFRTAKALFVPSLKRGIISPLHE